MGGRGGGGGYSMIEGAYVRKEGNVKRYKCLHGRRGPKNRGFTAYVFYG